MLSRKVMAYTSGRTQYGARAIILKEERGCQYMVGKTILGVLGKVFPRTEISLGSPAAMSF
jgi:hypothetical protein